MTSPLDRRTNLYMLRIWAEYLDRDPALLCGEIEHIQSHTKSYFQTIADLEQFLVHFQDQHEIPSSSNKSEAL